MHLYGSPFDQVESQSSYVKCACVVAFDQVESLILAYASWSIDTGAIQHGFIRPGLPRERLDICWRVLKVGNLAFEDGV